MSRRRLFRWILIPLAILIIGLGLLGNAEFRAPQIEAQLRASLERQLPFSELEAQDTFVQVVPWRGEVRVRLAGVSLRDDRLLTRPLEINSLQVSLPIARLLSGDYRPTRALVSGSRVSVRLPEQAASALPQPGEAESAEDYWGFIFQSDWLAPLTATLPPQVFKAVEINDVAFEVIDPTGTQAFVELIIDAGREQTDINGDRELALNGRLISPGGRSADFEAQATLTTANHLALDLAVGDLVPAQFYAGLRFLGLETPERLVAAYRGRASLKLDPSQKQQEVSLQIEELGDQDRPTDLQATATADGEAQNLIIAAQFSGIDIGRIAPWTPVPEYLGGVDLDATGTLDFSWDRPSDIWRGDFSLVGSEGRFAIPAIGLPANSNVPVAVRQVKADGGFDKSGVWLRDIELQTGEGGQIGPTLTADFVARTNPSSGQPTLTLDLRAQEIGRGDLFFLWPTIAAPRTRTRVETVVQAGAFSNFTFTGIYQLRPGDDGGQRMDVLGQDISAEFEVGRVHITDDMPLLTDAKGSLRQVGRELDIDVVSAQFGPAEVRNGQVGLDFRQRDWVALNFGGDVTGPLGPSLQVLAAGGIGLDALDRLPLDTLVGTSRGTMEVGLGFNPETVAEMGIDRETLRLGVSVDISDLRAPGFILGNGIESGNLSLNVDEGQLTGSGQAVLDGVPGSVQIRQSFALGEPWELSVDVNAQVPASKADAFVPGLGQLVDGTARGEFSYTRREERSGNLDVQLNLTDAALDLPAVAYRKSRGQAGNLSMQLVFDDQRVTGVERLNVSLPGLRTQGAISLSPQGWQRVELSQLALGRTNLTDVSVQNRDDRLWASVGNGLLDIEPLLDQLKSSSAGSTEQVRRTGALGFNLARPVVFEGAYFDTVRFGAGHVLRDGRVSLVMANDGLRGLDLNALVPSNEAGITGGRLHANVLRVGSGYRLNLRADNLGAAMEALGMGSDTRRGTLMLTGASDYPLGGGPWLLEGRGENIRLQKVPALVEVAAAISLTGILEQMSGSGLVITDLEFRGTLAASSMHVQRLKMAGPSLGLTLAGAMNWTTGTMNFRGAIAPFNIVNQVLGEIPVIRELFTGAGQEGLFAAQFGVKSTFNNPQVEVDPLSIIQPGLLRSLIDEIEGQTY